MLVDRISGIITVDLSDIKETPCNVRNKYSYIDGILIQNDGKRLNMVLGLEKLNGLQLKKSDDLQEDMPIATHIENARQNADDQILLFQIDDAEYAITIQNIKEIIRYQKVNHLPNVGGHIKGIISLRNRIIPIISIRKLLYNENRESDTENRIIIIDNGNLTFGIAVDRISSMIKINQKTANANNHGVISDKKRIVKNVIEIESTKKLILLLDSMKLITNEDMEEIRKSDQNVAITKQNHTEQSRQLTKKVVVFSVNTIEFAIEITHIREINNISNLVKLPGAPSFIEGMTSLREEIIPILNLKHLLFDERDFIENSKFLVVERGENKLGIIIDTASEVLELPQEALIAVTDLFSYQMGEDYSKEIAKLDNGRMIHILNTDKLLDFIEPLSKSS